MTHSRPDRHAYYLAASMVLLTGFAFSQGPLPPPGAPAPTMKTLEQIEPRTPISALPFAISASSSYYLTANLSGVAGQNGITISADHVTIDLNGFTLTGVANSNHGIATPAAQKNLAISNGTLRSWGGAGIAASSATNGRFEWLQLSGNTASGLLAGAASIVAGCVTEGNAGHGIVTQTASTISGCASRSNGAVGVLSLVASVKVSDCAVEANGGAGIQLGVRAVVSDCTARGNNTGGAASGGIVVDSGSTLTNCSAVNTLGTGIFAGSGNTLTNCSAVATTGSSGIFASRGSTLTNCSASSNTVFFGITTYEACTLKNCTALSNTGSATLSGGIFTGDGSTLIGCSARSNTNTNATVSPEAGFGIRISSGSTVRDCTSEDNKGDGIQVGFRCHVVGNTCTNNTQGGQGAGIHITAPVSACRIDGNHCAGGTRGIWVEGTDNLIVRNSAQGASVSNYSIVAGNHNAAVVLNPGTAFTSTNPWANFNF